MSLLITVGIRLTCSKMLKVTVLRAPGLEPNDAIAHTWRNTLTIKWQIDDDRMAHSAISTACRISLAWNKGSLEWNFEKVSRLVCENIVPQLHTSSTARKMPNWKSAVYRIPSWKTGVSACLQIYVNLRTVNVKTRLQSYSHWIKNSSYHIETHGHCLFG